MWFLGLSPGRLNPVAVTGAVIVALFILVAVLAPLLAPHDPYKKYLLDQVSLAEGYIPGLPNALSPVIVQATLTLATAIIDAATLSFLGLGDPNPDRAEWGLVLGGLGQWYFDIRPELAYYPAIAIIIVALGFTLLGESMREALDPKNRR
jgi:ABC-type dipeptide/oligopeptide/nickel transport system permease subunit